MIRILFVDDEPDLLELSRIYLESPGGIAVDTAPSARRALDFLNTTRFDVVVSDFQMPDMDGIEFLQYIRTHQGSLPVILFTGKGREEVVIAAINNGADYYLQKGGEPDAQFAELRRKIELAVERRRSEEKILFYNRLYAIMSAINGAVLHTRTKEDLFQKICTIAIDEGKFARAWIGLLDSQKTGLFPAACAGFRDECIRPVPIAADTVTGIHGLSGRAAFIKRRVIENDIVTGSTKENPVETGTGNEFHSAAAFPIWLHDQVIGTIQLYAPEPAFFGDDETRLLEEICSDISFALESIDADEKRRKTERALAESEEKFRILVEESLVGVYVIQGDRFLHVNPRFAEIMGYAREELVGGMPIDMLVAPESRDLVMTSISKRLSGEIKSLHYSFRGQKKDGSIIDLEVAGTRAILQGQPIIIGNLIDITERLKIETERVQKLEELSLANKKIRAAEERLWAHIAALTESQERLNESERRLTDIINFLPDATFAIDTEGKVLVWNRAIEKMTGIPSEAMVGKDNFEYAIPFYKARRPILADLVLSFDATLAQTYENLSRDGDKFTAQIYLPEFFGRKGVYAWFVAAPLYDIQGKIAGAIETIRDVTESEEVRRELQASKERYRTIIENSHEGIIIVRDGRIVYSNPGIRRMLNGYTEEDLLDKPIAFFIDASDQREIQERIEKRLSGTSMPDTVRFRVRAKDGSIHCLESRAVVIDWEGGPATLSFISEDPGQS